ncbi:hypothetical protein CB1_001113010 [Camelus ferus]|nr:hypothetical protein CB1_001113010 [Camelus ferus]
MRCSARSLRTLERSFTEAEELGKPRDSLLKMALWSEAPVLRATEPEAMSHLAQGHGLSSGRVRTQMFWFQVSLLPTRCGGRDIKYALIGTALGIAILAGFLALKICMIRKHLFDNDSSDLRSTNVGFNDTISLKKRTPSTCSDQCQRNAKVNAKIKINAKIRQWNDFFPFCHQSG